MAFFHLHTRHGLVADRWLRVNLWYARRTLAHMERTGRDLDRFDDADTEYYREAAEWWRARIQELEGERRKLLEAYEASQQSRRRYIE